MLTTQKRQNLLIGKWEKIVTYGGVFDGVTRDNNCFMAGLYVYIKNHWICISILEKEEDVFFISIYPNVPSPIPETEKRNNPPRKIIEQFPDNCRLDYLRDYGAKSVEFIPIEITENKFLCQSDLIIESGNGFKFRIEPSEEFCDFLEISMIS